MIFIEKRLKELRKERGISQLKLAMELNTNQNTISRYETGEREPGINELIFARQNNSLNWIVLHKTYTRVNACKFV